MNGQAPLDHSRFYAPGSRQDHEFQAMFAMMGTVRLWTRAVEQLVAASAGQTRVRWEMLFAIAAFDAATTASAIAQRIDMQWPAMVRVLDGLEEDGLIARRNNPQDRRSRLIELTTEGEAMIESLQNAVDPMRSRLFSVLSNAELNSLAQLAGKLQTSLAEQRK